MSIYPTPSRPRDRPIAAITACIRKRSIGGPDKGAISRRQKSARRINRRGGVRASSGPSSLSRKEAPLWPEARLSRHAIVGVPSAPRGYLWQREHRGRWCLHSSREFCRYPGYTEKRTDFLARVPEERLVSRLSGRKEMRKALEERGVFEEVLCRLSNVMFSLRHFWSWGEVIRGYLNSGMFRNIEISTILPTIKIVWFINPIF